MRTVVWLISLGVITAAALGTVAITRNSLKSSAQTSPPSWRALRTTLSSTASPGTRNVMVTFADGRRYKHDRIVEEANASQYFDKVVAYGPDDFTPEFRQQHGTLTGTPGFGYWVWKPWVIYKQLISLHNNDTLVWLDSGMVISQAKPSVVAKYYAAVRARVAPRDTESLPTQDSPAALAFRIKYKESDWHKMDTFNAVCAHFEQKRGVIVTPRQRQAMLDDYQRTASCIVLRKNQHTLDMMLDWVQLVSIPQIRDDSPSAAANSPGFRGHRHDQSVWSVLSKLYEMFGGHVTVSDDNFSDSRWFRNAKAVFHPVRRK